MKCCDGLKPAELGQGNQAKAEGYEAVAKMQSQYELFVPGVAFWVSTV